MSIYWQAIYSDGIILDQFKGARYQDIDRSRLVAFDLWQHPDDPWKYPEGYKGPGVEPKLLIRVDLRDDTINGIGPKRLIWRQRHSLNSRGEEFSFHLVGWQRTVEGINVQSIAYVFDEGGVFLGGQFDERDIFMYSVQQLECEE